MLLVAKNHSSLVGLEVPGDHPQYLLINGSRNLAGNWDLGGSDLTNGGALTLARDLTVGTDTLFVDSATGRVGIGTANMDVDLQFVGTNGIALFSDNQTNETAKQNRFGVPHYTNGEEPFLLWLAQSTSNSNVLSIGGGTALGNAATQIRFFTAPNHTTITGSESFRITPNSLRLTGVAPVFTIEDSGASGGFRLNVTGLDDDNDNLLRVQAGGNTLLTIRRGGNVGIMTGSPDTTVQVVGTSGFGDDAGNELLISAAGILSFAGTSRINWTKITANSATVTGYTAAGQNVTDLQTANDGNQYIATEVAGTPNDLVVGFTGVTAFNWIGILAFYDGNNTHGIDIQVEITPFDGSTWHSLDCMDHSPATTHCMEDHNLIVRDSSIYINSGVVNVKFPHIGNTVNGHTLEINEVALYQ